MGEKVFFILSVLFIISLISGCTKQAESEDQNNVNDFSKIESTEEKKNEEQEIINEKQLLPEFDASNMENSLKSFYPELDFLAYFPCNFSKEYNEEYLVFYNDPSYIVSYSAPLGIHKGIVLFVGNNKPNKIMDLKLHTLGYDERTLETILEDSYQYGKWNDYCYLTDSNGDGLDELYFYEISGISFGLVIMKYLNNEFEMVEYIDYMGK